MNFNQPLIPWYEQQVANGPARSSISISTGLVVNASINDLEGNSVLIVVNLGYWPSTAEQGPQ